MSGETIQLETIATHPLSLPDALWEDLSAEEQGVYRLAQEILEGMLKADHGGELRFSVNSKEGPDRLAGALSLLQRFGLVRMQHNGESLQLGLIATPEEHIRVSSPAGGHRWVFIARPIHEPDLDPSELN